MMSDPNTQPIGQSPGSATIIANIGIMIERPIKRPAMKLPACRNLANGFFTIFTIRSSRDNHASNVEMCRCASVRMAFVPK